MGRRSPNPPGAPSGLFARQLALMSRQLQVSSAQLTLLRGLAPRPSKLRGELPERAGLPTQGRVLDVKAPAPRFEVIPLPARAQGATDAGGPGEGVIYASLDSVNLPLTENQRALWIATQMDAESSRAYHMCIALRISGTFDPSALERALRQLARRHQALRTTFDADGAYQEFAAEDQAQISLELGDSAETPWDEVRESFFNAPFDLEEGPLWRCALIPGGPGEHRLLLAFHHLIVDGWSLGILLSELHHLYLQAVGEDLPALEPAASLADYVRDELEGHDEEDEAYWLDRFSPPPPVFEPPTDRPRPPVETFRGGRERFSLAASPTQALRRWSSEQGTTLTMTLLGAFQLLLHRLSGQDDVVVGMPAAGQLSTPGGRLVGYCLNILPMRSRIARGQDLEQHFTATREALFGAYEHQRYPLTRLLHRLNLPRDPSRAPLITVLFNVERSPQWPDFSGQGSEGLDLPVDTAQFDLNLNIEEGATLDFALDYRSDLFDPTTAQRWLRSLASLLEVLTEEDISQVPQLPLCTVAERHQFSVEWNDQEIDSPRVGLHQLIAERCRRHPQRIAAEQNGAFLSYDQLARRSGEWAKVLRSRGVGPEVLVAIYLDRSLDLITALLAVLEAGGSYLPLDPTHPQERLTYILDDAGARFVICPNQIPQALETVEERCLPLRGLSGAQAEEPPSLAPPHPENRAYALYTSGSTGRPKGVEISHRNLINFLLSMARQPGLDETDTLVSVTTLAFDIAGLELYLPLLTGARLVFADDETPSDGDRLAALLDRSRATVMQATPATWRLLLANGWEPSLRMLCGGEALPRDLAESLGSRGHELWNLYGPTETTIWSAIDPVHRNPGPIQIGRPIANTAIRVLGPSLEPLPCGVAGELWIAGEGLARGYLGRPGLTADRFQPDPFAQRPGDRLYRTGDLARWARDGRLEVLGRLDHQIKIRGLRIELGEIEAALLAAPQVLGAVVSLDQVKAGDQRLVAHVVLEGEDDSGWVDPLRQVLRRHLPEYMVPTAFQRLEALPLTPNGKVDRKALPPIDRTRPASPTPHEEPESELEKAVAKIWCAVLDLPQVGVGESFFDLGGHSLLLVEVRKQLRGLAEQEIRLLDLFRYPTVRALASFLAGSGESGSQEAAQTRSTARRSSRERQREIRRKRRAAKSK